MIVRRCKLQFSILLAIMVMLVQHEIAAGQLIGNRSIGGPALSLTQQSAVGNPAIPNPGNPGIGLSSSGGIGQASNAIGSLGSRMQIDNTRFVRGKRSRQDVVGSNRTDLNGFVGVGQALGVGRVPSSVENFRIETTKTKINRPLPPQPAKGMYYPRLEIDFATTASQGKLLQEGPASIDTSDRVAQFSAGNAIVTMSGTTAILRGAVNSVRTSELLVQLLSFEPGIDRVKNELVVLSSPMQIPPAAMH